MRSTNRQKSSKTSQWRRPSIEPLERRDLLSVYPKLLKDINLQDDSAPRAFAELNGVTYFRADDGVHGYELWRTDGTAAGSTLVKDTWAGPDSGLLRAVQMVRLGNALYFTGEDANGVELWKTDGTEAGTVMLKDIYAGADSSSPAQLTVVGSTLFFTIEHPIGGGYLWKTDGTAAGTVEVKDIRGGLGSNPLHLTNVGGTLYFSANDGTSGEELWKSDGTEPGTVRVADLIPGEIGSFPQELTNANGALYFFTVSIGIDRELWKVDAGTGMPLLVKDFGNGQVGPAELMVVGSTVFFAVDTASEGAELWKSDGSNAGTQMVKDILPGPGHSAPYMLVNVNGTLFFYANDGTNGQELWKSDGTAAGTLLVKDIRPGSQGSQFSFVGRSLINDNGKLIFSANDGTTGPELWISDGSEVGTVLVNDSNAGPVGSYPAFVANTAGTLYFQANNSIHGWELWKTNGTGPGTSLVKDINTTAAGSSNPTAFVNVGSLTYFFATDLVHGWELWVSNTATQGTKLVKDIFPGSAGSYSSLAGSRIGMGNVFYFAANDGTTGTELWRSDGTAAGTYLLKDIHPAGSSAPVGLTVVGNTLYFLANDGTHGAELWKTDGTPGGTTMVQDLRPGPLGASPVNLVNVNGTLYFTANDGTTGIEIWKSDGTPGAITLVKDIRPGAAVNSQVAQLTNVSGTLYFVASESGTVELWKSNGTAEGTAPVRRWSEGGPANPSSLTNVNGGLMFVGNRNTAGYELWKTDGTLAGTVQVKDINPGSTSSSPTGLTAVGNLLMFFANDGTAGKEIWKSDGTTDGTIRLRDIRPGLLDSIGFFAPSIPAPIAAVGDLFYFAANDGTTGTELWRTDGTVDGTVQVSDLQPGLASSTPARLVNSGGSLYFQANNGTNGAEPWVITSLIIDYFPLVKNRRIFYNQSKFDGGSAAIDAADDAAIATDKVALQFNGSTNAPLSAFTSYSRGINGIMLDVLNLGEFTLDDFTFKVGTNSTVANWVNAPAPNGFSVRPGAGASGSDRIVITWPNNAIQNTWLQVIVEGYDALGGFNTNTGLGTSDVFFFGSRIGDTLLNSPAASVTTTAGDALAARQNIGANKPITDPYDFDKSRSVTAGDELIARSNAGALTRNLTWNPLAGPLMAESLIAVPQLAAVSDAGAEGLLDDTSDAFGTLAAAVASALAARRFEQLDADGNAAPQAAGLEARVAADPAWIVDLPVPIIELNLHKKVPLSASKAQTLAVGSSLLEELLERTLLE